MKYGISKRISPKLRKNPEPNQQTAPPITPRSSASFPFSLRDAHRIDEPYTEEEIRLPAERPTT